MKKQLVCFALILICAASLMLGGCGQTDDGAFSADLEEAGKQENSISASDTSTESSGDGAKSVSGLGKYAWGGTQEETQKQEAITMGQRNAVQMAKEYLDYSAFSEKGLVEQLEYEGFSHEEAVYGVENSGADWMDQAAKMAQEYLDYSSFSRSGLIEQLIYEGFTQEQAEHGVSAVGY